MNQNVNLYLHKFYSNISNGTFQDTKLLPVLSYGYSTTILRIAFVLFLCAGYILVQLGSVPVNNIYLIILQNIIDIAVCTASFGLLGYYLAFGNDYFYGTVGYGMWLSSANADMDKAILGFSACLIATAIITTMLSGRVHFLAYFTTSFFYSGIFLPIMMHWFWHENGCMRSQHFMDEQVSVKDHAGGILIHLSAGTVGLLGTMFLGRRLLILSDIDEASLNTEAPGSTMVGYIFIILGLIGFSLPSQSYEILRFPDNYVGAILVNSILAMAAGIIVVVTLHFLLYCDTFNYWILLRCVQGAIAGLVSVASGVDIFIPLIAFCVAAFGAVIFYFVTLAIHNTSIEDYCNVIAIHFVGGLFGAIFPAMLAHYENLGFSVSFYYKFMHLAWQIICSLVVVGTMLIVFTLIFGMFSCCGLFRNKPETINHRRGVNASRKISRGRLRRLFGLNQEQHSLQPGVGKGPEQLFSGSAYPTQNYMQDSKNVTNQNKKQSDATKVKTTKVNAINDKPVVSPIFQEASDIPQNKKARFIYTVHNIMPDTNTHCGYQNYLKGTGDAGSSKVCEFVKEMQGLSIHMNKDVACYKLRRTIKSINLLRDKSCMDENSKLCTMSTEMHSGALQTSHVDRIFDDGFVTLKLPSKVADMSDGSDTKVIESLA